MADKLEDSTWKALAWMSASAMGFSLMSIFVKKLSPSIPQIEMVFFRSVINFVWVLGLAFARRQSIADLMETPGKPLLIFRGCVGLAGVTCLFYGLSHLPLPVATLLNWCSPFFVIVFSRLFLGERLKSSTGAFGLLGFFGLFLLMSPTLGVHWGQGAQHLSIRAVLITLLGAAFGGMAYVAVRAATARASVEAIVLYFMAVSTLISGPIALRHFVWPDFQQSLQLLALGTFAAWGQVTMTHAYRYAPASVVSLMNLLNPIFGAVFGFMWFNEWLSPMQGAGMVIILVSVAAVAWQS
jgi:drug/metabolite transporter (DMT)-like permease